LRVNILFQTAPELQRTIPPNASSYHHNQLTTTTSNYQTTDLNAGELPVKLELRYAIEAKRAERGLQMPIIEEIHRLPREVRASHP